MTLPIVFSTTSASPSNSYRFHTQLTIDEIQKLSTYNPAFLACTPPPSDLRYFPTFHPNTTPLSILTSQPTHSHFQNSLPSLKPPKRATHIHRYAQDLPTYPKTHLFNIRNPRFSSSLIAPLACFHLFFSQNINPYAILLHELERITHLINPLLTTFNPTPPTTTFVAFHIHTSYKNKYPLLTLTICSKRVVHLHITLLPHPTIHGSWTALYTPEPSSFPNRTLTSRTLWSHLTSSIPPHHHNLLVINPSTLSITL